MKQVNHILYLTRLAWLTTVLTTATGTATTDLQLGHFEVQIDYALSPGDPDAGWTFSISYDESNDFSTTDGVVRLDPATTTIVATPETKHTLSSSFQGLGDAGDSLWVLPQAHLEGQIFFGWRTIIPAGIFQKSVNGFFTPDGQGNIIIELVEVAGPAVAAGAKFAMWESKSVGGVEMHFNTADGIDDNDRLEPVPIGTHTHYNYGLTEPGNYEVTFRASARLNTWQSDGNTDTSSTSTFHFSVPFSSVATGNAELRLSLDDTPGPASIHPDGENVEYAPGQVSLVTQATEIGEILYPYAFGFDLVTDSSAEPHRVGLAGTQAVSFPAGASLTSSPLTILKVSGPGDLQIVSDSEHRRHFVFSAPGIYRVQVCAVANDAEDTFQGPDFELIFLAGLEADYDFADYADSFERSHGLASGSLKDDGSDYDGDGVPDLVEYQLFWEGFDPAIADAEKLPLPDPSEPEQLVVFHRDTYKDQINRNKENIVLEYSSDLTNWFGWSDDWTGYPLDQYEVSAEAGNAYGRIQRRALRLPTEAPERAFIRWRMDPSETK
ncbi:choice-of-anchor M domain-containing protein [Coraliomargarita sp. SDUM461004]|uniref:Choice-of-anchor M domain-containing protein n=1 Tax=Thalassobacterium sedimentorum TaxID=3041258 RepID=A0ABU1AIJ7_9BACT|nr:choice-of-anchor M domain-containing protein [Coraliomargarita sp. SDUM461004]MDQ8194449.1 choice-of-anchor M domain-containing protein [Coraliomargarita sp. SDUM461004]